MTNKKYIKFNSLLNKKIIIINLIFMLCIIISIIFYLYKKNNNTMITASDSWQGINNLFTTSINQQQIYTMQHFINANNNNYGALMTLKLVHQYVHEGNFIEAEKQLYHSLKQTNETNLKSLIYLRIARLQLQLHNINTALETLDNVQGDGWINWAESIRGDAEILRGNYNIARTYYEKALQNNTSQLLKIIVQMKINNLYIHVS